MSQMMMLHMQVCAAAQTPMTDEDRKQFAYSMACGILMAGATEPKGDAQYFSQAIVDEAIKITTRVEEENS